MANTFSFWSVVDTEAEADFMIKQLLIMGCNIGPTTPGLSAVVLGGPTVTLALQVITQQDYGQNYVSMLRGFAAAIQSTFEKTGIKWHFLLLKANDYTQGIPSNMGAGPSTRASTRKKEPEAPPRGIGRLTRDDSDDFK